MAENEETNWHNLPFEMKRMVIKRMEHITRLRFEQCSHESEWLSKTMPIYTKGLVSFDGDYWSEDKNAVYIDGRKIERPDIEANFYKKFLMANVRMKVFQAPMNFPKELIGSNKLKVETAHLECQYEEDCEKWLNHLAHGVKNLTITCYNDDSRIDSSVADHPNVINAKKLNMNEVNMNGNQLLKFKARKVQLDNITVPISGVIQLIKKWINEDCPIGSELFVSGYDDTVQEDPTEYCLRNAELRYSKRTRTCDNKTEITIPMKWGKYMEITPYWNDELFTISAKVRQSSVEPPAESFTIWNDLPVNIKGMIVEKMDIITRTRLKVCSKADKQLVETTPLHLSRMNLSVIDCFRIEIYLVQINDIVLRVSGDSFKICDHFPMALQLYARRCIHYRNDDPYNILKKVVNSFVMNENVTVEQADIHNWEFDNVEIKMKVNKLTINYGNRNIEEALSFNSTNLKVYEWSQECTAPHATKFLEKWIEKQYPIGAKCMLSVESDSEYGWKCIPEETPRRISKIPVDSEKYIEVTRYLDDYDWIIKCEVRQVPVELPAESTANWKDLPEKVKKMIVEKMDLFTRTRLKLCSKSDKQLVESTPLHLSYMETCRTENDSFKIDDILAIQVCKNDLLICNEWQRIKCESNEEANDRLKMIVNSFVGNANVTVDYAQFYEAPNVFDGKMRMKANTLLMPCFKWRGRVMTNHGVNQLLKKMVVEDYPVGSNFFIEDTLPVKSINDICNGLEVSTVCDKHFIKIRDNKYIELVVFNLFNARLGETCQSVRGVVKFMKFVTQITRMLESGSLTVEGEYPMHTSWFYHAENINDDEMLNIRTEYLTASGGRITKNGVNRLLKKMIYEDYPIGSSFRIHEVPDVTHYEDVCDGLNYCRSSIGRCVIQFDSSKKIIVLDLNFYKDPISQKDCAVIEGIVN